MEEGQRLLDRQVEAGGLGGAFGDDGQDREQGGDADTLQHAGDQHGEDQPHLAGKAVAAHDLNGACQGRGLRRGVGHPVSAAGGAAFSGRRRTIIGRLIALFGPSQLNRHLTD